MGADYAALPVANLVFFCFFFAPCVNHALSSVFLFVRFTVRWGWLVYLAVISPILAILSLRH